MGEKVSDAQLLAVARTLMCSEEKMLIELDSDLRSVVCLSPKCSCKGFFIINEYKNKTISCPTCNAKHKVRCYKNGSVRVEICEK